MAAKVTLFVRPGGEDRAVELLRAGREVAKETGACHVTVRVNDRGTLTIRTCLERGWDGPDCPKAAA